MDFMSTVQGPPTEGFYPAGWDLRRIDACCERALPTSPSGTAVFLPWNARTSLNSTP